MGGSLRLALQRDRAHLFPFNVIAERALSSGFPNAVPGLASAGAMNADLVTRKLDDPLRAFR